MTPAALVARIEARELLASPRGRLWLLLLSAALSAFALLLVSSTELGLLDRAQVLYAQLGLVTALGALLAVVQGADAVAGERERGSLLPLLVAPVSRGAILRGKLGGQAAAWGATALLALPYLWAGGASGAGLLRAGALLLLLGTPVVLTFGLLATGLGARLRTVRAALLAALVVLLLSASPLLLGPGLRQTAAGRAFDLVNPFSHALNGFDEVVVDSAPLAAQVVHLGVVVAWFALALRYALAGVRKVAR